MALPMSLIPRKRKPESSVAIRDTAWMETKRSHIWSMQIPVGMSSPSPGP